jgi:hypothetical protein
MVALAEVTSALRYMMRAALTLMADRAGRSLTSSRAAMDGKWLVTRECAPWASWQQKRCHLRCPAATLVTAQNAPE